MFFLRQIGVVARQSQAKSAPILPGLSLDKEKGSHGKKSIVMKSDMKTKEVINELYEIVCAIVQRPTSVEFDVLLPIMMNFSGSLEKLRVLKGYLETYKSNSLCDYLNFKDGFDKTNNDLPTIIIDAINTLNAHINKCLPTLSNEAPFEPPSLLSKIVTEYEFYLDKMRSLGCLLLEHPEFKMKQDISEQLKESIGMKTLRCSPTDTDIKKPR